MTGRADRGRRRFLVSLATAAGSVACTLVITRCDGLWGDESLVLEVADLLTFRDDAQIVGGAYLEQAPDERDRDRLVELVLESLRSSDRPRDPKTMIDRVRAEIRRDFEEDRIVRIQDWMLSRTEARLYALIAVAS